MSMPALLADGLPSEIVSMLAATGLTEPRLEHIRHKPGVSLVGRVRGADDEQSWWFAAYAPAAAEKAAKIRSRASKTGIDLLTCTVPAFPDLEILAGPIGADKMLTKSLHAIGLVGADGRLMAEVLSYNPFRRLVARVPDAGVADAPASLIPGAVVRVWAEMPASMPALAGLHRVGAPVLQTSTVGPSAIVQPWAGARSLDTVLAGGAYPGMSADLAVVGSALARLHRTELPDAVSLPTVDPAGALSAVRSGLAEARPDCLPDFDAVAARTVERLCADDSAPMLLHGDFSADQVVLADTFEPVLIDLDRMQLGPAGFDLGDFAAVELLSGRDERSGAAIAEGWVAAFGTGPERDGARAAIAHLPAWTALHILLRALKPFRDLSPRWSAEVEERIALAARVLDGSP